MDARGDTAHGSARILMYSYTCVRVDLGTNVPRDRRTLARGRARCFELYEYTGEVSGRGHVGGYPCPSLDALSREIFSQKLPVFGQPNENSLNYLKFELSKYTIVYEYREVVRKSSENYEIRTKFFFLVSIFRATWKVFGVAKKYMGLRLLDAYVKGSFTFPVLTAHLR